jgi:hypothetical protein
MRHATAYPVRVRWSAEARHHQHVAVIEALEQFG